MQAVKAGHIEGRPVLSRPGVFVEQPSPVDILWCLARGVREHSVELTDGDEMQSSAVRAGDRRNRVVRVDGNLRGALLGDDERWLPLSFDGEPVGNHVVVIL